MGCTRLDGPRTHLVGCGLDRRYRRRSAKVEVGPSNVATGDAVLARIGWVQWARPAFGVELAMGFGWFSIGLGWPLEPLAFMDFPIRRARIDGARPSPPSWVEKWRVADDASRPRGCCGLDDSSWIGLENTGRGLAQVALSKRDEANGHSRTAVGVSMGKRPLSIHPSVGHVRYVGRGVLEPVGNAGQMGMA